MYDYHYSFKWWLRMYSDVIDLLKTAIVLKSDSSLSLLTEKEVVSVLGGILPAISIGTNQETTAGLSSGSLPTSAVCCM